LEQVSQDLRIRPTILAALEREDYFGMPLKGHSRNMVSAYSRYLGLDSALITELFLQNYRDFEHAESIRRRGVQRVPIAPRNTLKPTTPSQARRLREQGVGQGQGQGVRSIWDKPETRSEQLHYGYDSRSPRTQRSAKSAARRRPVQGIPAGNASSSAPVRQRRPSQPGIASLRQGNQPQGGIASVIGHLMSTTPLPLVLLVVGLVAMLVIWAVVANSCSSKTDEYVPALLSGNGAGSDDDGGGSGFPALVADDDSDIAPGYGPFVLKVEVVPGMAPWVQVTVDGVIVFDDYLSDTRSYDVQADCKVQTYQTDNVKVYRNNVAQAFVVNANTHMGTIDMQVIERPVNDNTTNTPAEDGARKPASSRLAKLVE
jgi:hypothetical protein